MESDQARYNRLRAKLQKYDWNLGVRSTNGEPVGYWVMSLSGTKGPGYGPDGKPATLDEVEAFLTHLREPLTKKLAAFVAVFDARCAGYRREDVAVPDGPYDAVVLKVYPKQLQLAYTAMLDLLAEKDLLKIHVDSDRGEIRFPASALPE
jgi:hypothetical protein